MEWQPIETAPSGDWSETIDMWANGERVTNCSWSRPDSWEEGYCWCMEKYESGYGNVNYAVGNATHWMPLPDAP